jgi:hypothetical protein
LHRDLKSSISLMGEGKETAIAGETRACVIVAFKRNALRFTTRDSHPIDLWSTAAIGGEVQMLTVSRPGWLRINSKMLRQLPWVTAFIDINQENIRITATRERYRKLLAIR